MANLDELGIDHRRTHKCDLPASQVLDHLWELSGRGRDERAIQTTLAAIGEGVAGFYREGATRGETERRGALPLIAALLCPAEAPETRPQQPDATAREAALSVVVRRWGGDRDEFRRIRGTSECTGMALYQYKELLLRRSARGDKGEDTGTRLTLTELDDAISAFQRLAEEQTRETAAPAIQQLKILFHHATPSQVAVMFHLVMNDISSFVYGEEESLPGKISLRDVWNAWRGLAESSSAEEEGNKMLQIRKLDEDIDNNAWSDLKNDTHSMDRLALTQPRDMLLAAADPDSRLTSSIGRRTGSADATWTVYRNAEILSDEDGEGSSRGERDVEMGEQNEEEEEDEEEEKHKGDAEMDEARGDEKVTTDQEPVEGDIGTSNREASLANRFRKTPVAMLDRMCAKRNVDSECALSVLPRACRPRAWTVIARQEFRRNGGDYLTSSGYGQPHSSLIPQADDGSDFA